MIELALQHPSHVDVDVDADGLPPISKAWRSACGPKRPNWTPWGRLRSKAKHELLHDVAQACSNSSGRDDVYVDAYDEMDIALIIELEEWSVEHVVARSKINGREPGDGEDDPLGWIEASRKTNSRRSNHPLVLWPLPANSIPLGDFITLYGVRHYVPPEAQRARLARKWAFVRATYPDEVSAVSTAQSKNMPLILSMMKHTDPFAAELCVNAHFRAKYGWGNPLLESNANDWLNNVAFRGLVAGVW